LSTLQVNNSRTLRGGPNLPSPRQKSVRRSIAVLFPGMGPDDGNLVVQRFTACRRRHRCLYARRAQVRGTRRAEDTSSSTADCRGTANRARRTCQNDLYYRPSAGRRPDTRPRRPIASFPTNVLAGIVGRSRIFRCS